MRRNRRGKKLNFCHADEQMFKVDQHVAARLPGSPEYYQAKVVKVDTQKRSYLCEFPDQSICSVPHENTQVGGILIEACVASLKFKILFSFGLFNRI